MPAIRKPEHILREERIVKAFKIQLINKGWTKKHLADLMKIDCSALSRAMNHPMHVKLETILNIAVKLGMDSIPL